MNFKEVREDWWLGQIFDKREITIHRMSECIRCHIAPYFDDKEIEDISDTDINLYLKSELGWSLGCQ